MNRHRYFFSIMILTITILSSTGYAQSPQTKQLQAYAAIEPVEYIARQVGGQYAQIHSLMPNNQNPHTFEPTPKQMAQLAGAQLYFKIGIPFEEEVLKRFQSNFAHVRIIDCSQGIAKRNIEEHTGHHNHEENEHSDDEHEMEQVHLDPHIWLSPPNAIRIAETIRQAFTQTDPGNEAAYQSNYDNFAQRATAVHTRLTEILAPFKGQRLYVFHPAFGYFTDTYGIEQVAIETGGKSPTPKQLAHIIQQAKAENVKIIFVQPQFEKRNAQAIASAINGSVVMLNPLEKNLLDNFTYIADTIDASCKQ